MDRAVITSLRKAPEQIQLFIITASDVTGFTLTWTQTQRLRMAVWRFAYYWHRQCNVSPLIAVYVPSPFYSGPMHLPCRYQMAPPPPLQSLMLQLTLRRYQR